MIYTTNIAGGHERGHRTIYSAACRMMDKNAPFGGYTISRVTGKHAEAEEDVELEVSNLVEEMIERQIKRGEW